MSHTLVKYFYRNHVEDLVEDINVYAQENDLEIQSLQVFQSLKNSWYESIVVFEKLIVISVEQATRLTDAFEIDTNDQVSKPLKKEVCQCRSCKITRSGSGYAPCSGSRDRPRHVQSPPKKP